MNVKEIGGRFVAFDDHIEAYVTPQLAASRVGEGKRMTVAHPVFQNPVNDLRVVGTSTQKPANSCTPPLRARIDSSPISAPKKGEGEDVRRRRPFVIRFVFQRGRVVPP